MGLSSVVIASLISGGAAVAGGAINASASGNAANEQAQSAANALALQKQVYDAQVAARAPYVAAGQTASGQEAQIASQGAQRALPLPYGATYAAAAQGGVQAPAAPQIAPPAPPAPSAPAPLTPPATVAQPASAPVAPIPQTQTAPGTMVTMRAPTGQLARVPASAVAQLQALGATVVPSTGGATMPGSNSLNGYGQLASSRGLG